MALTPPSLSLDIIILYQPQYACMWIGLILFVCMRLVGWNGNRLISRAAYSKVSVDIRVMLFVYLTSAFIL